MDFDTLQQWVKEGEHLTQEFKRSTAQLKPAMQTLCAFLNEQGGKVLIGITDDGKIVGQQVADKTRDELGQILQQFEPHPTIHVHYIPLQESSLHVIMLEAKPQTMHQPYVFSGRAYERKQTTTHIMSQSHYEQLLLSRNDRLGEWESRPALHIAVNDLDVQEIFRTIQQGISQGRIPPSGATHNPIEALEELGLLQEARLIQAAVVLFARNPFTYYPQCSLRLACFNSTEKNNFIDNKQMHGHVFMLIDAAIAFAHLHLPVKSHFEGFQRVDDLIFPKKVLREALLNAFAHRDYSVAGGAVSFIIYSDRVEISSYGSLPPTMTIEKLKKRHQSLPCNPKIANALYRRGLIDEHGVGTREIIELTLKAGQPEPEFIEDDNTFTVCLKAKDPIRPISTTKVNSLQEQILSVIHTLQETATLPTIHEKLGTTLTQRQLRYEFDKLKKAGAIKVTGRGKNAIWEVSSHDKIKR